jgi:ankyrin repeat protein
MSALIDAVNESNLSEVKSLLAAGGIDICAKDHCGNTALHCACAYGNVEIAKELLAALKKTSNFDINDKGYGGNTALIFACVYSRVEVVKLLLTVPNINTHLKNSDGKTALDRAKGEANEDEIKALFQGELLPSSSASYR